MLWVMCNTDGASRGNPGPSSAEFWIRDSNAEIVFAKGVKIDDNINLVAEAIRQGLIFCRDHGISNVIIEPDSLL